jgi:hypothetical protein
MARLVINGRVEANVVGSLCTAFSLIFVVIGITEVVKSAQQAAMYLPATATVVEATGMENLEPGEVSLVYSFVVNGKRYTVKESDNDVYRRGRKRRQFSELRMHDVGEQMTVYYDPHDPSQSRRFVQADATALVFVFFAIPFLALGLNRLWLGLTGREMICSQKPNAKNDVILGDNMFCVLVFACIAGALAHLFLCSMLPWPWSLVGGLIILFVAVPAMSVWANHVLKRWRSAKGVKQPAK